MKQVDDTRDALRVEFDGLDDKRAIFRSSNLRALFDGIKEVEPDKRAEYGKAVNELKLEIQGWIDEQEEAVEVVLPIDVTAPWDVNVGEDARPKLLPAEQGSVHPLMAELDIHVDIFSRMGYEFMESREIDDDYHMFTSLNFPLDHPARDDYDTFITDENLVAPAHVSTMQNRLQKKYAFNLENGEPIAVVYAGRTFRNEDVDARHEHTFYQVEMSYIAKNVTVGNLTSTIKEWLSAYYEKEIEVKIQPFYFPFTEPSFEFAASCTFCNKKGCNICSQSGWIELGGCGLIHPNVLKAGGIDPLKYTGFAGGFGLERLAMLKYGIEDIRHFESANLKFLRQF